MSELNKTNARVSLRHGLLLTVSVTALLGMVGDLSAKADESESRPIVWIELGGQWDHMSGQAESFVPPFTVLGEQHGLMSAADVQSAPRSSIDENGSISFQPDGSDWKLSASIRYGRSSAKKERQQQTIATTTLSNGHVLYINGPDGYIDRTADYAAKSTESHAILDFTVGKDIGLGLWRGNASSQIALGVRFAQFTAKSSMELRGDPYPHRAGPKYFSASHVSIPFNVYYQFYKARPVLERDFRGFGPSLSWSGSVPVVGSHDEDAEITFDWGANGAILFGRQKAQIHHNTTADRIAYLPFAPLSGKPKYSNDRYVNNASFHRSRSLVVPNVGALAGMSLKFTNAKVSLGYRADFFFGAMDGGIDTRKSATLGFYGPFASVSIGIGG